MVEKPGRHHLDQVISIDITRNKSCWHHVPLDEIQSGRFTSVDFFQNVHDLNPVIRHPKLKSTQYNT